MENYGIICHIQFVLHPPLIASNIYVLFVIVTLVLHVIVKYFVLPSVSPTQVIDVGSGKGYLSSFLSLQYALRVYGIDSSSTNTHGAQERNRKLKKFSRVYQKHTKAQRTKGELVHLPQEDLVEKKPELNGDCDVLFPEGGTVSQQEEQVLTVLSDVSPAVEKHSEPNPDTEELFLSALSEDVIHTTSPRIPPSELSAEERERRKRENLERKALSRTYGSSVVFSPLTSYVTAETELRELIGELEVSCSKKVTHTHKKKPKLNVENRFNVCAVVVQIGVQPHSSEARSPERLLKLQVCRSRLEFALLGRVWDVSVVPNARGRHHQ